jgi:cell migration-inducing and hyaluronan-binding protein
VLPDAMSVIPAVKSYFPDIKKQCKSVCETWAVKDVDCPAKGCLGFAFTLPGDFVTDNSGQKVRPQPEAFPTTAATGKPDWTTHFERTATKPDCAAPNEQYKPFSCYYPAVPGKPAELGTCK